MKKLFLLIGVAFLVSCASLVSCISASTKTVHDPSVPVEQTALIYPNVGTITGYNGMTVNWEQPLFKGLTNLIQIPAGNTILEWNLEAIGAYSLTTGKNILFAYNFRPQKKYFFYAVQKDEKYGLNVYAYNLDEKIRATSTKDINAHFEAFAPFLNVRDANERTILE